MIHDDSQEDDSLNQKKKNRSISQNKYSTIVFIM